MYARVRGIVEKTHRGDALLRVSAVCNKDTREALLVLTDGVESVSCAFATPLVHCIQGEHVRAGDDLLIHAYVLTRIDGAYRVFVTSASKGGRALREGPMLPRATRAPHAVAVPVVYTPFAQLTTAVSVSVRGVVCGLTGPKRYENPRSRGVVAVAELLDEERTPLRFVCFNDQVGLLRPLGVGRVVSVARLGLRSCMDVDRAVEILGRHETRVSVLGVDGAALLPPEKLRDAERGPIEVKVCGVALREADACCYAVADDTARATLRLRWDAPPLARRFVRVYKFARRGDVVDATAHPVDGAVEVLRDAPEWAPRALEARDGYGARFATVAELDASEARHDIVLRATLQTVAPQRSLWYLACPKTKRKLEDVEGSVGYSAASDDRVRGVPRWCLRVNIIDNTGEARVSFFDDAFVRVVGESAAMCVGTEHASLVDVVNRRIVGAQLVLRCKVVEGTYAGNATRDVVCQSASRLDPVTVGRALLEDVARWRSPPPR